MFFNSKYQLSQQALEMDLLVIKKHPSVVVKNEIGKIFKRFNVFEYKGSGDSLSIDDYYKTISYGCLYKALGEHVNEIPAEELTLTMIREAYPRELFRILEGSGVVITEEYKGIYYLSGKVLFDTQVIVTGAMDGKKHPGLKILSKNAQEEDVRTFLQEAEQAREPGERSNIDAVLQVSVSENAELFEKIRRDERMCQALKELMKDEIAKEVADGRAEERVEATTDTNLGNIKELMKNMKWTAEQAMKALGFSEADCSKYSAML